MGGLYRIESCTALTTALSGQGSRPNAPRARQHHGEVMLRTHIYFRGATWLSRENFTGELFVPHYFTVGRIRPNSSKMESQNGLESPEDRRSALSAWKSTCMRAPPASKRSVKLSAQVDPSVTIAFPDRRDLCRRPCRPEIHRRRRCLSRRRIMLRVVVLGAAAGGGVPQWNCGCPVCRAAREHARTAEHPGLDRVQCRRRALVPDQRLARPSPAIDRHAAAASQGRRAASQPDRRRDPDQWRGRCGRGPAVDARGIAVHDLRASRRCWRS